MRAAVLGWIASGILVFPGMGSAELDPQIIIYLEEPLAGAVYTGVTNLRGWAVGPDGIARVDYFIDGVRMGDIPYGGERQDVADVYPAYPDSDYSGFSMAYNYSRLAAGAHTILVRAHDPAGNHNGQSRVFSVTRFADPFISDPQAIDLVAATAVEIDDASSLTIYGARVEGVPVNLSLQWRTANQDLNIVAIGYEAAGGVYDFESLLRDQAIDGEDGWELQPGLGNATVQVDDRVVNGTQVVRHVGLAATNQPARLTRENDTVYSFPPVAIGQTVVVLQFDATGEFVAQFALGHDVDGNDILAAGELGPSFGLEDRNFLIQRAAEGSKVTSPFNVGTHIGNSVTDWYRLRLRIDVAANGGDGAGSLSYMNLTRGDLGYRDVLPLQNVNLGLTAMSPDAAPDEWNAMWLQLMSGGGATIPSADNLMPNL